MATLGTGIIILIVLWSVALLLLVVLCSSQGKLKNLGIVPSIIAAIVTIILASIPTKNNNTTTETLPSYNYSYASLIWILILTGLCVTFVGCLIAYLLTEIMEPRYAKVSKTFKIR